MDATQEKAVKLAEQTAAEIVEVLPEATADIVPYEGADTELKAAIETRMSELDMSDTQTIIKFGSGAQQELTALSDLFAIFRRRAIPRSVL